MRYKPEMIAFHITDNCMAHCPMCYENANCSKDLHGEIEKLKKMVHNAIAFGHVENFLLVGGDPCEHPRLMELLEYIKAEGEKYGVPTFVEVLSNTHDYRRNGKIVPMEEVAKFVDKLNVTLHGTTPEAHDAFNGVKGSYIHVLKNMKNFIDVMGEGQSVGATVNVMPQTVHNINQIVYNANIILNGKIKDVCVQRIAPSGRAVGEGINYFIEKQDVDVLFPLLEDLYNKGMSLDICDCFPYCSVKPEYRHLLPKGGCQWGKTVISVKPNGTITRCALSSNALSKNLLELDSEEKWLDFWENDPELKTFREKCHLDQACKSCHNAEKCGGGCVVAREYGDPYKGNPQTPIIGKDYLAAGKKDTYIEK